MMTQLIDSHTHIYAEEFDEDFSAMLQRAEESGVSQMVLPCVDSESWALIQSLSEAYPERLFPPDLRQGGLRGTALLSGAAPQ